MSEVKKVLTEVCILFSPNSLEYTEIAELSHFEMRIVDTLLVQGFEVKVHTLSSFTPASTVSLLNFLVDLDGLKIAYHPELWFFGSDLTRFVFAALERAHSNTKIRNQSTPGSALDTYLDLCEGIQHAQNART